MTLPKTVVELLSLLTPQTGGIPVSEVPARLRSARDICLGNDPPLAQQYKCGAGDNVPPYVNPMIAYATGRSVRFRWKTKAHPVAEEMLADFTKREIQPHSVIA